MKKDVIFCAMLLTLCMHSMHVDAQLEILSSGDVKVSKKLSVRRASVDDRVCLNINDTVPGGTTAFYGVKSYISAYYSMPTSPIYALYGYASGIPASSGYPSTYPIVGVYGYASKNFGCSRFNAAVVGVAHYAGGIGIYGSEIITLPTSLPAYDKYAGYFNGSVNVNGTNIAAAMAIITDESRVDNIQALSNKLEHNNLTMLQPVSYTLKPDSAWMENRSAKELLGGVHYGLIAQDVQKVLPELVYERGGDLSVNYIELIPLLIQEIQDLSNEVQTLKAQMKELQTK